MKGRSIWPRRFGWLEAQIRGERRPIFLVASRLGFTKERDRNNFPISHCVQRAWKLLPMHFYAV